MERVTKRLKAGSAWALILGMIPHLASFFFLFFVFLEFLVLFFTKMLAWWIVAQLSKISVP
jgi:hypothetical protein